MVDYKNLNCTQHKTQETTGENLAENPELTRWSQSHIYNILYCVKGVIVGYLSEIQNRNLIIPLRFLHFNSGGKSYNFQVNFTDDILFIISADEKFYSCERKG